MADAGRPAILSYAGRVASPRAQPVAVRSGGFGGAEGLAAFLRDNGIGQVIDATHPFAARISANAAEAARRVGVSLLAIRRPAWVAEPGDRWTEVADMAAAAEEADAVFTCVGNDDDLVEVALGAAGAFAAGFVGFRLRLGFGGGLLRGEAGGGRGLAARGRHDRGFGRRRKRGEVGGRQRGQGRRREIGRRLGLGGQRRHEACEVGRRQRDDRRGDEVGLRFGHRLGDRLGDRLGFWFRFGFGLRFGLRLCWAAQAPDDAADTASPRRTASASAVTSSRVLTGPS